MPRERPSESPAVIARIPPLSRFDDSIRDGRMADRLLSGFAGMRFDFSQHLFHLFLLLVARIGGEKPLPGRSRALSIHLAFPFDHTEVEQRIGIVRSRCKRFLELR